MATEDERTREALLEEIAQLKAQLSRIQGISEKDTRELTLLYSGEARFSQLLEALPITVFIYQTQRVVYLNPAGQRLGGYDLEKLIRKGFWHIIHPDSVATLRHAVDTFHLDDTYQDRLDIQAYDVDGELRSLDVFLTTIYYSGQPALLGTVLDVTERQKSQEQHLALTLEKERVKVLTDFVRDVSHDFRTPLSTINTGIYLLGRVDDPIKRQQQLDTMREQVKHLDKLVDGLLTMSRLDSGVALTLRQFDLNLILIEIIQDLTTRIEEKKHTISFELDDNLSHIMGDIHEIHRAMREIIMNAVQYTPNNGEITIISHQESENVIVQIRDNGYGVHPQDLPYIFDRFFRADQARSIGGVGLGLAIVRKVIEHHHGTVDVKSIPNQGTQVTIVLPIYYSDDAK